MAHFIYNLWRYLTGGPEERARVHAEALLVSEERVAINSLSKEQNYQKALFLLDRGVPFRKIGARDWVSVGGTIRVCNDIFGYEVKLHGGSELLDCCPAYYGLTKKEAMALYDAILSNIPGSALHYDRV